VKAGWPRTIIIRGAGDRVTCLEKFFDRVNHDKLMGQVAKRISDKRVLKLIRAFLNAGVMRLRTQAWRTG